MTDITDLAPNGVHTEPRSGLRHAIAVALGKAGAKVLAWLEGPAVAVWRNAPPKSWLFPPF